MKTPSTSGTRVLLTAITYYNDGTESWCLHNISPMEKAACESVIGSLVARLFETPVNESGTPGGLVPGPSPAAKIECSLEVINDTDVMRFSGTFPDAQLLFSYE